MLHLHCVHVGGKNLQAGVFGEYFTAAYFAFTRDQTLLPRIYPRAIAKDQMPQLFALVEAPIEKLSIASPRIRLPRLPRLGKVNALRHVGCAEAIRLNPAFLINRAIECNFPRMSCLSLQRHQQGYEFSRQFSDGTKV